MTREEFMLTMLEQAKVAKGMGARINGPAAAAHAANESAFGRSVLATEGRNLFGVKATGQQTRFWTGTAMRMPTWEVVNGQRVNVVAAFRTYPTWAQAFGDYADIIGRVYPTAAANVDRDVPFLAGLFLDGPRKWATDPAAFDKACRILGQYHALLYPAGPIRVADVEVVVMHDVTPRTALEIARGALAGGPIVLRSPAVASVTDARKLDVRWTGGTE